jgi:L-ribulose-5-phosphate 4-epimerase
VALYRAFDEIGAVVHTHSTWATSWAQAQREIPLLGTTHADLCAYPIPLTRLLTEAEVASGYEGATGEAIIEAIASRGPVELPCVLVRGHAPFCWGPDPAAAVANAVTLEEVARMALLTSLLEPHRSTPRCAKSTTSASTGRRRTTGSFEPAATRCGDRGRRDRTAGRLLA